MAINLLIWWWCDVNDVEYCFMMFNIVKSIGVIDEMEVRLVFGKTKWHEIARKPENKSPKATFLGSILSWGVYGIHQWTRLSNSTTRASICRYTTPSSREQHMSVWPARRQMQRSKPCEEAGPGAEPFRRFSGVLEMWETMGNPMPDTKLGDGV